MPTPEEIENIAKQYAEFTDLSVVDQLRVKLISKEFLTWVLRDYCIVPKELIRKEYEKAQKTHDIYTSATCINEMESRAIDHAEGRMCELTTLFGKSLFNEEKG